jgi:hypothetical protein
MAPPFPPQSASIAQAFVHIPFSKLTSHWRPAAQSRSIAHGEPIAFGFGPPSLVGCVPPVPLVDPPDPVVSLEPAAPPEPVWLPVLGLVVEADEPAVPPVVVLAALDA